MYKSSNSLTSPTWTQVGDGQLPELDGNKNHIDKDNPSTVYVCYGGYMPSNIMKTVNNGQTWTNIWNAKYLFFLSSAILQMQTGFMLEQKLACYLVKTGESWSTTNDGPINTEISDLMWINNTTL